MFLLHVLVLKLSCYDISYAKFSFRPKFKYEFQKHYNDIGAWLKVSSKKRLSSVILNSAILIMLLLSFLTAYSSMLIAGGAGTSQATTSIKVLPSTMTVNISEYSIFNVSVWVYDVADLFAHQVYLAVDDSFLYIKSAWLPVWNSSYVFYGKTSIKPAPALYDSNNNDLYDSVKIGDSLIWGSSFGGTGLLAIIELGVFERASIPATTVLNITNKDTYLLDTSNAEIPTDKYNGEVTIVGEIVVKEPSQITLNATLRELTVGQSVMLYGAIITPTPVSGASVTIEYRTPGLAFWKTLCKVDTNATGCFSFEWMPDVGSYELRAKWDGNKDYYGATSDLISLDVKEAEVLLEVYWANPNQTSIGDPNEYLPSKPATFNVSIYNVTDLYKWQVKIYYESFLIKIDNVFLPTDHIFANRSYSISNFTGMDEYGCYILVNASLLEGQGFNGSGTLFQFNATGLRPNAVFEKEGYLYFSCEYGDFSNTSLWDSSGNKIFFRWRSLSRLVVKGRLFTKMKVINPETNNEFFSFNVYKYPVGSRFNATIVLEDALEVEGWAVKLSFNSSLLTVTRVFKPSWDSNYVFYGKETSPFWFSTGSDYVLINETLLEGESPVDLVGKSALLVVVEFEIVYAPPPPANASEISMVGCKLDIENEETVYLSSSVWTSVECVNGIYTYSYGSQASDEEGRKSLLERWLEYWPYFVTIIVVVIAIYIVIRRRQKKLEEIYIEE